ncbi:hypothetical protein MesoLj131b_52810 [Mesorhizobium sp. 131-2-5]|nr:hypothetical protein MesoLj131b_52810 [Mesorhizobium sp. 131-2-5]
MGQRDHVIDAVFPGDLDRAVGGAIIDYEPFHRAETRDLTRQIGQCDGERPLLIQAWDLNNKL